jgi:hypothetical protein
VPRLAGQQHDYLVKTLMDFRNNTRANNPAMSDLMNSVTPEQIEANGTLPGRTLGWLETKAVTSGRATGTCVKIRVAAGDRRS